MTTKTTPVGVLTTYKNGKIRHRNVYADQMYKLPFWLSVKLKLSRWINGQF